jgi:hypothetical protein
MSKGAITRDVIIEGDGNIDGIRDDIFEIPEGFKVIFAFDVFFICGVHAGEETAEGCDAVSLTDAKDGCIDVRGAGFKGDVCVCNGTTGIIVEVTFDITGYDATEGSYEIVDLSRIGTSNLKLV